MRANGSGNASRCFIRGGEERKFREWLITRGYLEAIIGLPSALFYGTTIGASVIVINKTEAHLSDKMLFINADREYKEGKNQNKLRPEDIEKIAFVYRNKKEIPKYSKLVAKNKTIDELNSLEKKNIISTFAGLWTMHHRLNHMMYMHTCKAAYLQAK